MGDALGDAGGPALKQQLENFQKPVQLRPDSPPRSLRHLDSPNSLRRALSAACPNAPTRP